ncbi:bifunctional protein-disulfide isomerase/oxidoreductase DsbC [Pseudidiomarina taiwanensis]|uniref:Thiol:disulfide interchange protein n=1 Tax=Pseudidiomarina taiwanensis TaxID=337250 RepID=A0A432ZNM2_9GAMM|nr:bifunctional protein-disulfide isomerase/oxidoreductase DsbC [Pseudidiomarina taiwanensis]RUO79477.1 bifunctional protein-disulfide isomerase/oxidoreductase DsbC [Pseudidiomarina taiwanensis]
MKKVVILSCLIGLLACSPQPSSGAEEVDFDARYVEQLGFTVTSVADSPVAGLLEVMTDRGLIYVSADGERLISGRIFDITQGEPVNLSDLALNQMRQQDLATVKDQTIDFNAADERFVVTVFTDPSCGYCRQLHQRVDEYNELGISIRYLAYPRNGMQSSAANQLRSVWCADDPQQALTAAKQDDRLLAASCDDPVAEHYALGRKFGVSGTPAIILPNGQLIPGYAQPQALIQELEKLNQ